MCITHVEKEMVLFGTLIFEREREREDTKPFFDILSY